MKKLLHRIKNFWYSLTKKRKFFYSISLFFILCIFLLPIFVYAGLDGVILNFFQGVLKAAAYGIGWIASVLMKVLVFFATWKHYVSKDLVAVTKGWEISRDICNMFFILILLIVSFATIIGVESYSYKKWLSKIILFAIFINFSKTITGLLIDFSQVVMLTFVSGFKDVTVNNIAKGLHLTEIMALDGNKYKPDPNPPTGSNGDSAPSTFNIFIVMLLTCIMLIVLCVVLIIMITMLVGRIISLWILVILSPFAFLLQASPFGARYANEWWQTLSKNLISGPLLAMFLYLALYTISESTDGYVTQSMVKGDSVLDETFGAQADGGVFAIENIGMIIDFVIVIALLIAAIKMAGSLGVMGSSFAGQMANKLQTAGSRPFRAVANWGNKAATGMAKGAAGAVGRTARRGALGAADISVGRDWRFWNKDKRFKRNDIGRMMHGWNKDLDQSRNDKVREQRKKMYEKLGIGGRAKNELSETLNKPKMRAAGNIIKGIGDGVAAGAAFGLPAAIITGIAGGALGYKNRNKQLRSRQAAMDDPTFGTVKKNLTEIADKKRNGQRGDDYTKLINKDGKQTAIQSETIKGFKKEHVDNMIEDLRMEPVRKRATRPIKPTEGEPDEAPEKPEKPELKDPGMPTELRPGATETEKRVHATKLKEFEDYHNPDSQMRKDHEKALQEYNDPNSEKNVKYKEDLNKYNTLKKEWNTYYKKEENVDKIDAQSDAQQDKERVGHFQNISQALAAEELNNGPLPKHLQKLKDFVDSQSAINDPVPDNRNLTQDQQKILDKLNENPIMHNGRPVPIVPGPGFEELQKSDQYKDSVTPPTEFLSRKTSAGELSEETGKTSINGLIRDGESQRNRMGLDFREIEEEMKQIDPNFEVNSEGMHIDGKEAVSKISGALNNAIDKELKDIDSQLNEGIANGTLDDKEVGRLGARQSDLLDAKKKISSGDVESLDLINSGLKSGFTDKGKTIIHEDLHAAGMKNEKNTEALGNYIKDNHLYSLTSQLGNIAKQYDNTEDFDPAKIYEALQAQSNSENRVQGVLDKSGVKQPSEEDAENKEPENEPDSGDGDNEPEPKPESTRSQLDQKSISAIDNLTRAVKKETSVIQEDTLNRKISEDQEKPYKIMDRLAMRKNISAVEDNTIAAIQSVNTTEKIVTIENDKGTELENRVKDKENI